MKTRCAVVALLIGSWLGLLPSPVSGGVVVVANRTEREVRFRVLPLQGPPHEYALASGDLVPVPVTGPVDLAFAAGSGQRQYRLEPDSAYFFGQFAEGLNLQEIGFGTGAAPLRRGDTAGPNAPAPASPSVPADPALAPLTIPVKILVDEEEPSTPAVWEKRLRQRLAWASDLVEKHCRVRFEVVAVASWRSDNRLTDFDQLLSDFEGKVDPRPARLAIGFTSQLCAVSGGSHLGGTRGALHRHILIREWTPRTEAERLEVLLHELGHHLGAAHSPESDSVMRPRLGDGKAIVRRFRIGFDPANTLAMCLFAEEIRTRGVTNWRQLSPSTRERLRQIYGELARALPEDPVAARYVALFRQEPPAGPLPLAAPIRVSGLLEATRAVLAALVQAAEQNQRLPLARDGTDPNPARWTGDRLTEFYFREAAGAAHRLPAEHAVAAYLLALGIGLDSTNLIRKSPGVGEFCRLVETDAERRRRLDVLGTPTMHGRPDLTMHFAISSALTVLLGPKGAEAFGILKEQLDAQGDSGFSFVDLCADQAGIAFAQRLMASPTLLPRLAKAFRVADYLPDLAGLREGFTQEQFRQAYGSVADERFRAEQAALWKRIRALPGHH